MASVSELQRQAEGLGPEELLRWAQERFRGRLAAATSLGAEDQVLTDMIARAAPGIELFTLDTGRLHQETYDVLEATHQRYGLEIRVLFPDPADVEPLTTAHGPNSFRRGIAERKLCCQARKVKPLRRRLASLDAWLTGLRREQAVSRAALASVEWDEGNGLVKINPLAEWSQEQVWEYIRRHDVPYNALHDHGYPSIGCACCTRAVAPGEDVRSGRWWWELPEQKECGLHVAAGKLVRSGAR